MQEIILSNFQAHELSCINVIVPVQGLEVTYNKITMLDYLLNYVNTPIHSVNTNLEVK